MQASRAAGTRQLSKHVVVVASPRQVWAAWTTAEGARTFFAPDARIEPETGGAYEISFMPDAPEGTRGSDGCIVLAAQPERMLSFTWNAPPHMPSVRQQRTCVVVDLEPLGDDTLVTLTHVGWGRGGEWDAAFDYFDRNWDIVLGRLVRSFAEGPVNWDAE